MSRLEYQREWRQRNKEKVAAYTKKWNDTVVEFVEHLQEPDAARMGRCDGWSMGLSRARMDHGPWADSRVSAYTKDFYYGF